MTFFAQWELLTEKGYRPYLVMDWRKANKYRVCAAQRGRDFEAPDLEQGIHFRGVF